MEHLCRISTDGVLFSYELDALEAVNKSKWLPSTHLLELFFFFKMTDLKYN